LGNLGQGIASVVAKGRLVRVAKTTALASALWTIFCAFLLFGLQVKSWWQNGIWRSYSVMALVQGEPEITYATASYREPTVVERLLEIPAIVLLIVVATLLLVLHGRLTEIEKQSSVPPR
jgi:hypothetical protein